MAITAECLSDSHEPKTVVSRLTLIIIIYKNDGGSHLLTDHIIHVIENGRLHTACLFSTTDVHVPVCVYVDKLCGAYTDGLSSGQSAVVASYAEPTASEMQQLVKRNRKTRSSVLLKTQTLAVV
jgi:hypothetical protein